jgi:hypothetical protein
MSKRLIFVIAAGFALTGCCPDGGCFIQPPTSALASSDGFGPLPKRNNVKPSKVRKMSEAVVAHNDSPNEDELAALKPYSKEWWSVRDAIDRAADVKLSKTLIICQGCMPSEPDDQTGSIPPK